MSLLDDISLGWRAPFRDLLTGIAIALPLTGVVIVVLSLVLGVDGATLVFLAGLFQLLAGFAIAGRVTRRRG
ncbi:hypothetical protein Rumeso_01606 [Rubellimicrobium mesophilum DSM 19309]|uniref:Uncharacterized protein n=1 Tax=Rubellimicrobium mesophilum DSM 19309 TaxID=442562 RepID=A0A017HR74_9RHOB|nr:hypothetical protein [Rubellimicrobium mesophilum]EYD76648.1 hypothetical protein Rumeso_01606 [Rubellimicrobium mesophilum DSM 19309]